MKLNKTYRGIKTTSKNIAFSGVFRSMHDKTTMASIEELQKRFEALERETVDEKLRNLQAVVDSKSNPYRSLLLSLEKDLDERETEKIIFFLNGKLNKKELNERQSMSQLLFFMEKEGLLAKDKVEMLTNAMESIRRGDLIDRILEYQGLQCSESGLASITTQKIDVRPGNTTSVKPRELSLQSAQPLDLDELIQAFSKLSITTQNVPNKNESKLEKMTPNEPLELPPPSDISSQQLISVSSNTNIATNRQIDRLPSAGALSVRSDENVVQPVGGLIPDTVLQQIVAGVNDVDENLAIELGYSNEQIISYNQQFSDRGQRVKRFILDWQLQQADRGVIASRLLYALNKVGCKVASQAVKQWMDRFEDRQGLLCSEPGLGNTTTIKESDEFIAMNASVWLQKYNLSYADKYIITNEYGCMNDKIINAALNILKRYFPHINGFQNVLYLPHFNKDTGLWTYDEQLQMQDSPSVQIHHNGNNHWVMSYRTHSNGPVIVLDSLEDNNTLNETINMQLSQIYDDTRNNQVETPVVQTQEANSSDCGVFAIAYVTELVHCNLNCEIYNVRFDIPAMRLHLINCLGNDKVEPFPKEM